MVHKTEKILYKVMNIMYKIKYIAQIVYNKEHNFFCYVPYFFCFVTFSVISFS